MFFLLYARCISNTSRENTIGRFLPGRLPKPNPEILEGAECVRTQRPARDEYHDGYCVTRSQVGYPALLL